jgi:hypothetical protein
MKQSPPPNTAEAPRYHIYETKEKQKDRRKGRRKNMEKRRKPVVNE